MKSEEKEAQETIVKSNIGTQLDVSLLESLDKLFTSEKAWFLDGVYERSIIVGNIRLFFSKKDNIYSGWEMGEYKQPIIIR